RLSVTARASPSSLGMAMGSAARRSVTVPMVARRPTGGRLGVQATERTARRLEQTVASRRAAAVAALAVAVLAAAVLAAAGDGGIPRRYTDARARCNGRGLARPTAVVLRPGRSASGPAG